MIVKKKNMYHMKHRNHNKCYYFLNYSDLSRMLHIDLMMVHSLLHILDNLLRFHSNHHMMHHNLHMQYFLED